jgi:hypothetical protein
MPVGESTPIKAGSRLQTYSVHGHRINERERGIAILPRHGTNLLVVIHLDGLSLAGIPSVREVMRPSSCPDAETMRPAAAALICSESWDCSWLGVNARGGQVILFHCW